MFDKKNFPVNEKNERLDKNAMLHEARESGQDGRTVSGKLSSYGGTGDPHKASPSAIARYIEGAKFPLSRDELQELARRNGAPEDVMYVLSQFGSKQYNSVIEISQEVGRIEPGQRSGGGRQASGPSPAEIEKYLKGASFPSSKEELVNKAKQNGAPEDIVNFLNQFPEERYGSPVDVSKAFSEVRHHH